jgi:nitrile hydratase beta subunit
LDGHHDMGGRQEFFGPIKAVGPHEPPFSEEWERRAFALALLSRRVSGTNLDAFRHAIDRVPRDDYLADGYYGRWLRAAENLLTDSGIIAPDAVDVRTRKLLGQDVDEPAAPGPRKPDYEPTGPGSLRAVEHPPRFSPGDTVRARAMQPTGHTRLPAYVRGRTGTVGQVLPAHLFPDTHAHFAGERAQHVYRVAFPARELWGDDSEDFVLTIDLYDDYLEPA